MSEDTKHRERPQFDSDWSDSWNRAWISPHGEVHPLTHRDEDGQERNQTHFDFADGEVGVGKFWDSSYRKLLKNGWVRKVSHRSYHVGDESGIPKVLDHLRKHHPDVELARVMVHSGPVLRTQREHMRYLTKDGEVYEATEEPVHAGPAEIRAIAKRAKLDISQHDMKQLVMGMRAETEHDKPGDTDIIKGSKTARAEKLLKVALAHVREKGDYYTRLKKVEESWIDKRDAGWIAPDDTYHQLPKGSVHDLWIKNNGALLAAHGVKPDAFGYDKRAIIASGWIQKHGDNVYSAHDRSAVPRIVKHFTERHPDVKRVMVSFKTGGNVYVTRDGTVKEPVPYRAEEGVQENWMLNRSAAWISPEGDEHPLDGGQYHAHWVEANRHRIHQSLHRGKPFNSFDTEDAMVKEGGWIKKQDKDSYHAAPGSVDRVRDYVAKNHPEVEQIRISGAGRLGTAITVNRDGKVDRTMVYENWLATRHAAWISPDDREHRLRGEEFHTDWIRRNAATHVPEEHHKYYQYDGVDDGLDAYGTKDKMLAAGWIRKQDKNVYYVHDPAAMKERIVKHVRQNHPEINRVHISSPQDELWVDVDHGKKVNEAWRGGTLDNWLQHRTAGWIAPDHTYHQLNPGEHHREWSTNPRNSRHLRDVLGVIDPARHWDANVVQHEMMKQGWIRKLDHDQYLVGRRSMIAQALRHHERFHPHKNRVEVAVENYPTQGSMHRFYFQRDPNTREILPRRDWREKRRLRKSQQDQKWGSSA